MKDEVRKTDTERYREGERGGEKEIDKKRERER